VKLELTTEGDERDEDGEPTGALAAAIFGRNPSSGRPAAAWLSEARPRGRAGRRAAASGAGGGGAAGQQEGAAEVRRPEGGRGRRRFSAWEERRRDEQVANSRCASLSREADVFWAWAICSFLEFGPYY
jgi:hypothetical protein